MRFGKKMASKERKRSLTIFAYVLLVTMMLALPLNVSLKEVKAQETPKPKIQIVPSETTIGRIGGSLPTPLTTINVTVTNVTDLYAWQIKIYFDDSILQFENVTGATIPKAGNVVNDPYNIFWNKEIFPVSAVVMKDLKTNNYYVKFGSTLLGDVPGVNGSGVLCQLNFKGASTGTSYLNFAGKDTFLLNTTKTEGPQWYPQKIPADLVDATVNVLGNGISINVYPDLFTLGEEANITGLLFPPEEDTDVTIFYQLNGTDKWNTLTTKTIKVPLNATYWEARYAYLWKPDKEGLYWLKAEGGHKPEGGSYESRVKAVTVNPKPVTKSLGIEFYGSIAAVVGASAAIFFVWDRRRRHSGRIIMP